MKLVYVACTLLLVLGSFGSEAKADSWPISNGRYTGGPVTILQLTESQQKILTKPFTYSTEISLSKEQIEALTVATKLAEAPTKLMIIKPETVSEDCTCGAVNVGLLFTKDAIEVPHLYLCSDKEAEEQRIVE